MEFSTAQNYSLYKTQTGNACRVVFATGAVLHSCRLSPQPWRSHGPLREGTQITTLYTRGTATLPYYPYRWRRAVLVGSWAGSFVGRRGDLPEELLFPWQALFFILNLPKKGHNAACFFILNLREKGHKAACFFILNLRKKHHKCRLFFHSESTEKTP